jgi:hypothetical protein
MFKICSKYQPKQVIHWLPNMLKVSAKAGDPLASQHVQNIGQSR